MPSIDLNGEGDWSFEALRSRYFEYCHSLGVPSRLQLAANVLQQGPSDFRMPILEQVLEGVVSGDAACVQIAVDFVCSEVRLPFGKIFKDRAADSLRRVDLSSHQSEQLRASAIAQLYKGFVPPEFKRYARLLRQIGLANHSAELKALVPAGPRIAWYRNYLLAPAR